jgi:hypothetical protein
MRLLALTSFKGNYMLISFLIGFNVITALFALEMFIQNRALRSDLVEKLMKEKNND